jgi:colanic acid/amylovoran biosynthesis glycosyltransferase
MTEQTIKSGTIDWASSSGEHPRFLGTADGATETDASVAAKGLDQDGNAGIGANLRLAYMTGQYPRATDTFIQREVTTLRGLGYYVQAFSVRKPPETENVGSETAMERKSTTYLLPPIGLFRAHLAQLLSSPKRYFSALALAARNCPPGIRAIARQIAYFAEAAMLARLMKKHSLSHLHNHLSDSSCSVAAIAAEMGGFTFSFTMHGPAEFYEPKLWWIDEKVRRALFVNCISHFCRSQAMVFAPIDCWGKLRIVHCGVDPKLFEVRKHAGCGKKMLFVGRLAAAKGLPILLEAVAKIEGARLDVAGDGPDRKMLEAKALSLGLSDRVRFIGYQSQHQVRELLKETDVFVLTSFAEGVPVVLMEAMAAGVPVVATQIAGIPELVTDGHSGLLVSPGDVDAAAHAIFRLLEDANLRNRFAAAGREKIEREFDIHIESRWLATILTSALAGKSEGLRPS